MSDAGNTWTDERVEQLRKLWGEGLSASQIATEIGGVSRNAVIGKVHRLGLSGRTKTPAAAASVRTPRKSTAQTAPVATPVARQPQQQAPAAPTPAQAPAPMPRPLAAAFSSTKDAIDDIDVSSVRIAPSANETVAVPLSERVTIMDLREYMCRWPVGDPTSPGFRFCGARSATSLPYCSHHASIAYQPVLDRRRDRKRA